MPIFEPITVGWQGVEYSLPTRGILKLIIRLEDILEEGRQEPALVILGTGQAYGRLAIAYGEVLAWGGCKKADPEAIYSALVGDLGGDESNFRNLAANKCAELIALMTPPEALRQAMGAEDPTPGKPERRVD